MMAGGFSALETAPFCSAPYPTMGEKKKKEKRVKQIKVGIVIKLKRTDA
jgi:hypothetical protein